MAAKPDPAYEEDDGETIVNMDVEGMPWYDRRHGIGRPSRGKQDVGGQGGSPHEPRREFSKEELRAYKFAALKASLIVVAIFGGVFGLFIAFCDFVLFRG